MSTPLNGAVQPPQMNSITPALEPWQRMAYTKAEEQALYRDWGTFLSKQQQPDLASQYYEKSLAIKNDEPSALYRRSVSECVMAKCENALNDASLAASLEPHKPQHSKAIADALYGLNEFEQSKVHLHESTRKFNGAVVNDFLNRITVVDENLKDSLGDPLRIFFRDHEDITIESAKRIQDSKHVDNRPLWKKLKAESKCDVLSVLEPDTKHLPPIEVARRERQLKIFNQIYMGRTWKDVIFMQKLKKNPTWCKSQCKESGAVMYDLVSTKYDTVKKFIKMLHARSPMYNEYTTKFPNRQLKMKHRESYLYYKQNQTRREMHIILRKVKQYRANGGDIVEFATYVERMMGDYVILKTHRIMPWRFEFMVEVYNTLGLYLADRFKNTEFPKMKPVNVKDLFEFLHINTEPKDQAVSFVFGNKSTSMALLENENKFAVHKAYIARLEKRMHFSKHPIEKAYLWHCMAGAFFLEMHYDACIEYSKKAIEEARKCNGYLWAFLGAMLIVRSHAALVKVERCRDALVEALGWAYSLKDEKLIDFVETVIAFYDDYLELRKKTRSMENLRKRRISTITITSTVDEDREIKSASELSQSVV